MKPLLIRILAVGRIKDAAWQSKCAEFLRWIGQSGKIEIEEIRDSSVEKESDAILKRLEGERGCVIVLAEEGEMMTSREFASRLGAIDRRIVFVIGGPFGLSDAVKRRADWLFSFSRLTVTHEMARCWLLEQIFRATAILQGKPYHHD